jgi:hypothetical protein
MLLSHHAVVRYRQRVEGGISYVTAVQRLTALMSDAKHRSRPRYWTPIVPAPGLIFLYPHARPDICLLVKEGVVVTVVDRASARRWKEQERFAAMGGARSARPYRRPAPGADLAFEDAA